MEKSLNGPEGTPQQFGNHCDYNVIRILNIFAEKNPGLLTVSA
jgi:hypothetical protein